MSNIPVLFRDAGTADLNFIFNSWLKSGREVLSVRGVRNEIYFSNHHELIQGLLDRSAVVIACNPTDTEQIFGYVVGEQLADVLCVHYCYVKQPFRTLGIGSRLIQNLLDVGEVGSAIEYTHQTHQTRYLTSKFKADYNPYLAFREQV